MFANKNNGKWISNKLFYFGQVVKQAVSDISTSTDVTTATTFTFPSPVFLQANTEYCFVLLCNNDDYTMYTARLGQTTLDG